MSYEIPNFGIGIFPADVDMSGDVQDGTPTDSVFQFSAVVVRAAQHTQGYGAGAAAVAPAPSAGVPILGLLQQNPQLGEAANVAQCGVSKAQCGATVSIGQILMAGTPLASGAVPLVPATSGNYGVAQALESGVSGVIIAVLLQNYGKQ
jgi:hypothetical protein